MNGPPISIANKRGAAPEIAEQLREVANQAERGDIVSLSLVYERPNGDTGQWHSATGSRMKMAGALLDAANMRLGYVARD